MRNPIQLFKDSISLFSSNFALFLGILIAPLVLSVLILFLEPQGNAAIFDTLDWAAFILATLAYAVLSICMGIALTLAVDNPTLTVSGAYKASKTFFWRYLGLSILMSAILFVAFLLLIIPGIILSIWFIFATYILVLEKSSIIDSLKRSKEYVKGKWWGIFGRIIAGMLILMLFIIIITTFFAWLISLITSSPATELIDSIVATFFSLLPAPIMVAYMYFLYKDAKGDSKAEVTPFAPSSDAEEKTTSVNAAA